MTSLYIRHNNQESEYLHCYGKGKKVKKAPYDLLIKPKCPNKQNVYKVLVGLHIFLPISYHWFTFLSILP